jgi:hypothetical protein
VVSNGAISGRLRCVTAGPTGRHVRRGRGGAQRRRLDQIRLNSVQSLSHSADILGAPRARGALEKR